ncbi:MAG: acetyltransferase [Clostridiales bacterium]|jgi:sugar O-acyltransferase (sialic acid O-acetyltransferase NeuD family)|nr:acetyltransferase [Clostridiales bacterium]
MKKLVIIGAGGHGKVVADNALKNKKYESLLFLDDSEDSKGFNNIAVAGKVDDFFQYINDSEFIVAIGNNTIRAKITSALEARQAKIATLIHPDAVIGSGVRIGCGTVVMAGAVINTGSIIGKSSIINTCSSIDHDCIVGNYCHISVGAHLAGSVVIGKSVFVGAGATVIDNIKICSKAIVGAGAVVTNDLDEAGTYVGVPVKRIK